MIGISRGFTHRRHRLRGWARPVIAVLFCLMVIATIPTAASAVTAGTLPTDVSGHWASDIIQRAVAAGVARPDPDGKFYPDRPATRGEFVAMLLASRQVDSPPPSRPSFSDVPTASPFFAAVEAAYRLGYVEGIGSGKFGPTATLSREEAVAMVMRATGRESEARAISSPRTLLSNLGLTDGGSIAAWALRAVAFNIKLNIIQGYPDRTFKPKVEVTRAQTLTLLERLAAAAPVPANTVAVGDCTVHFRRPVDLTATAYGEYFEDVGPWLGGPTYFGLQVREGVVAVDPNVIPLGTHLYVIGYGYAIAADVGSAIKGARIDLFLDATAQAIANFGIQPVKAYILDGTF